MVIATIGAEHEPRVICLDNICYVPIEDLRKILSEDQMPKQQRLIHMVNEGGLFELISVVDAATIPVEIKEMECLKPLLPEFASLSEQLRCSTMNDVKVNLQMATGFLGPEAV